MEIFIGVATLILLIILEMPIAFALMTSAVLGLWITGGGALVTSFLGDVLHEESANYVLLTVPMFVLMSQFMAKSGMARDIVVCCDLWLGRIRGGLAVACVMASAFMAAVIGSSTASTATMSTAAYPTMREVGYSDRLAVGVIAISGTLAIMIPPSIILIIYGILTEVSIGKLLIAGVGPGLLTVVGYTTAIMVMGAIKPDAVPARPNFDRPAAVASIRTVWPVFLLMTIVIGALYSGIATPTEVGAIGSLSALVIVILMQRLQGKDFLNSLTETVRTTVMIIAIISGALMFGYFLTLTQATQNLLDAIRDAGMQPWTVMIILVFVYLILGMLMDQLAILVLTVPVTFALISQLGFDGIWYGIIITKTVEIGLVTPPLGLNIFVASSLTKVPVGECFKGVAPFILVEIIILVLLLAFPQISLFLPGLMG
ncbi:TRAP transporter large permease [uncultured Ruegeria sp.]|uniref:TRAP transporter large permease n=1 Tax=uncultured Ruegeria sp. TaxID=259304 RepID=UPI002628F916|nr:TRAP transporter large permease [uncultured Ruegeria sp.]